MLIKSSQEDVFHDLFVLELANNHLGSLSRGIEIIRQHAEVVRLKQVRAAIKLQFRDVDTFIHPDFKGNKKLRYIKKTEETKLRKEDLQTMVNEIKLNQCLPMATPFDEASVDLCMEFELPIIKIASADTRDKVLINSVIKTKKPVVVSTGGITESELDHLVELFENKNIPLAINHCVSLYPSEDEQLCLDQIDYLINRYPSHVIGFSTHEYTDWSSSLMMSYAKGARTWERHVDIAMDGVAVSPYCSLPDQCATWFDAYHKARAMCGGVKDKRRLIPDNERVYLDALVRGVYAKRTLPVGYEINKETLSEDFYFAVPLRKGQLSTRELDEVQTLKCSLVEDQPLMLGDVAGSHSDDSRLKQLILDRGV